MGKSYETQVVRRVVHRGGARHIEVESSGPFGVQVSLYSDEVLMATISLEQEEANLLIDAIAKTLHEQKGF